MEGGVEWRDLAVNEEKRMDGGYRKEEVEEGREKGRRGMGEVSSICGFVPRPHPLTRKIGSGDLRPIPRA